MAIKPKEPMRNFKTRQDLGSIDGIKYNDAAGADKVIVVDPPIKRAVGAGEAVGAGKYVKITGTSYTLDLINRDYDSSKTYQRGDVVAQSTDIYMALGDGITGSFDTSKWRKVAPKQISSIPVNAGDVVTTGRWHNTVSVAGFLVDDESDIRHTRTRD